MKLIVTAALSYLCVLAFFSCVPSQTKPSETGAARLLASGPASQPAAQPLPPRELTLDFGGGVTMQLVLIPPGKFTMGPPDSEKDHRQGEGPQREVTISKPFYIGIYEVTQEQWKAVMGTEPWKGQYFALENPDAASHMSGSGAMEFCRRVSQRTGRTLRLPTTAEWEYACRAGSTTRVHYSYEADLSWLGEHRRYDRNARNIGNKYARPVRCRKPNAFGLYDMHGKVWEWCSDWWRGSMLAKNHYIGGPFLCIGRHYRSAYGCWISPEDDNCLIGLRVAVSVGPGL